MSKQIEFINEFNNMVQQIKMRMVLTIEELNNELSRIIHNI